MASNILVTGGAGFIGSHLVDTLIQQGHRVRIYDNLEPQIHPNGAPGYLNPNAELVVGDIRDKQSFASALEDIDVVFHLAAAVGTGQSMYQINKYTHVNVLGLATLLEILIESGMRPKIVFPGSATSYGEAAHRCPEHGIIFPDLRPLEQLERREWDVLCPQCGRRMEPVPIPEHQPLRPKFVYGVNKKSCEELLMSVGDAYGLPYTILRFFNVYGPRQSLSNPYTGVIPIFSSRIKNGKPPLVIEDGYESRDFVSVHDVVRACVATIDNPASNGEIINIGSGRRLEILEIAKLLIKLHGSDLKPDVNFEFRKHDFRHSLADISKARRVLGFEPRVKFEDGMRELFEWTKSQEAIDNFDTAYQELKERGMVSAPVAHVAPPRVAVVTLNWNGFAMTVACVEALRASTYRNIRILVVDNGSKNHDAERLRERFGTAIEVIANPTNLGVAGGNNSGLRVALQDPETQYCIMMNNDLLVTPETIERLVQKAEADNTIGMVASRMMNFYERERIDNLGIALLSSGLGYNRKSGTLPLFCPCSGLGLYRADALRRIALPDMEVWDPAFFAYVDELDVGFRIRLLGYSAEMAMDAVGYHKEGASSGGATSDFSIFHGHRNNLWFIVKNLPAPLVWRNILSILATQLGTFVLYAKRRRLGVIIRAKWAALKGIPLMRKKRAIVQKTRTVSLAALERAIVRKTYYRPDQT